ncbi:MAG: hypothetical protein MJZ26_08595 [Fibrobacter sp.]|nr:hypothetical protein [Fibrobacter sp.]
MKNRALVSVAFTLACIFSACSNGKDSAGGTTEGTNALAIVDKDISGVSQKGPFIKGSPVTVLELEEKTLKQTGRAFRGKVTDNGNFIVKGLNLESNYAILEANGYYWNEITGEKSKAPITLNAIADISDRDNVNINLLTQLEYERVIQLVEKDSLSVSEAKKQAKKEILKALFYSNDSLDFEDLNIFESGEGDALLLAASIMILAGNTEAEITELLYDIAEDMENGKIDNDSTQVSIADRVAFDLDVAKIRKNIQKWEMSDSIPAFENFIENFWANQYKLGTCDKDNEGKIKKNGNKQSQYVSTNFLCKDGHWKAIYYNPDYKYDTITDKRDGQTYRTTKIGNQVWMAENMKYKPKGANEITACYDDKEVNCDKYGFLYDLNAALVSCPEGFRIPSESDWKELADLLGGDSIAGPKLRAIGGWNTTQFPSTLKDKDEYGFSALPAGVHFFGGFGSITYFWTDHVVYRDGTLLGAYNIAISDGDRMEFGGNALTTTKISLRCIKGEKKVEEPKEEPQKDSEKAKADSSETSEK